MHGNILIVTILFPLILILFFPSTQCIQFGRISNATLIDPNAVLTSISYTTSCDECLCAILKLSNKTDNNSVIGFNCFLSEIITNRTCQMFSNITSSYQITYNRNITVYFLQLPAAVIMKYTTMFPTTLQTTTSRQITTTSYDNRIIQAFWSFDNTTKDLFGTFNGIGINSTIYSSSSITGYGSALLLSANRSRYVNITTPMILSNSSFTFELWIYINSYSALEWLGIIGKCINPILNRCLHIGIRQRLPYIGFFNNDCSGNTSLKVATWYHLSFIYDSQRQQQFIYLNGVLDCFNDLSPPLLPQTNTMYITIGRIILGDEFFFDGMIDQVFYVNRVKTSEEILQDATLIVKYSFDDNSTLDQGPNKINGSNFNVSYTTNGRFHEALLFSNISNNSYFLVPKLVLVGISNRSYSIAMWLQPTSSTTKGVIAYLDAKPVSSWYMPILGFVSSGHLVAQNIQQGRVYNVTGPTLSANTWTHVIYSYSANYGLQLYVNGTLISRTGSFYNNAVNTSVNIILGNYRISDYCNYSNGSLVQAQYYGAIDEFQVYSRELSLNETRELADL